MSTNYHTAIPNGAEGNDIATYNDPLGQLDSGITTVNDSITTQCAKISRSTDYDHGNGNEILFDTIDFNIGGFTINSRRITANSASLTGTYLITYNIRLGAKTGSGYWLYLFSAFTNNLYDQYRPNISGQSTAIGGKILLEFVLGAYAGFEVSTNLFPIGSLSEFILIQAGSFIALHKVK